MKRILYMIAGFLALVNVSRAQQANSEVGKPIVIKPTYFAILPALRDLVQNPNAKVDMSWKDGIVRNRSPKDVFPNNPDAIYSDPNVQREFGTLKPDTTSQNFDGVGVNNGVCPPDPAGDVGPNHYVDVVNLQYAIYSKTGTKLLGPFNTSQIWTGMSNNSNDGDAIVLYDEQADRWLMTQFSLPNYPNPPFFEMVAISQTPDPTGSWYIYQYSFPEMPDYPKLGVWPDAYYICVNRFSVGGNFLGPGAGAFDRTKLLAGNPAASMIYFPLTSTNLYHGLPADCDGTFPPAGTPGYFAWSSGSKMNMYEFHSDWTTPANSTFGVSVQLNITPFSSIPQNVGIPQQGTGVKLAALSNNYSLMNRLQFRTFSDHWSMVVNGTVDAGSSIAGIRWYEFRRNAVDQWSIYQQATYAPGDGKSRWNGSIAMDSSGNIALAYSISNASMYPSLYYTGRMNGDPLNTFTIAESGIINGGGSQTNTWSGSPSRWGDYSALTIDPVTPKMFWYTNEYYSTTSQANWKTRVASFSFGNIFSVDATATPSVICNGESSQLNANASGGSGTYTYSWTSLPAGFTSTLSNPVVSPVTTTKYIAAVNDGSSVKTDTATVTVNSNPTAYAGPDATYPNTAPLFPVSGTATNFSSVKWTTAGDGHYNFDTIAATLYYPGPVDKNNGGVDLTFTANPLAPCAIPVSDLVHITLTFPTGITDNSSAAFGVALSPNPSNGNVTLVISGVRNTEARISISDLTGKEIFKESATSSTNSMTREINLTGNPKGIYFVKVSTDQQSLTRKLVLQ
ncbi:MAG: T9SS type A sorting domain-containing protein [Bacteroidetes bacterium]|nr:T9SS type A sorting domain-containing protein [Bacteroidota bacterium]